MYILLMGISFLILAIDIISKRYIEMYLNYKEIIHNFLDINYTRNYGISFNMLDGSNIFIIILNILILVLLLVFFIKEKNKTKGLSLSYGFILGGLFGNLFDRVVNGYVIDFISFKIKGFTMPIFNFSDIMITCGVVMMLIFSKGSDSSE